MLQEKKRKYKCDEQSEQTNKQQTLVLLTGCCQRALSASANANFLFI